MRLIISEKDNAAKRIAAILANGGVKEESQGRQRWYYFKMKDGAHAVAIGLRGHILGVDFTEGNENWAWDNLLSLIDAPLRKTPQEAGVVTQLRKLAKEADEIIVATDFDREGELIGVEALQVIAGALIKAGAKSFDFSQEDIIKAVNGRPIGRARYSALTKKEIEDAFSDLKPMDWNLSEAAETRQDIDLIWGAALTRFVSLVSGRRGRRFLSVGRVQSPTLSILVDREAERRAFVPEPYWQLKAIMAKDEAEFPAIHKIERFKSGPEAETAAAKIAGKAAVAAKTITKKQVAPPPPFHTTSFLAAASSLGFSPANAMSVAEGLYMNGFISYPRVDNTVYPPSLDLRAIIDEVGAGEFAGLRDYVLSLGELTPTRGKKQTTDHPPIHPTGRASRGQLEDREWKIYELVVRRFFATLSKAAVQESMKVDIDASGEPFVARGIRLVEEGFLYCYPYSRSKGEELPPLAEGDELRILSHEVQAKETQPPGRYGAGRLIELMESLGLGTKATRHEIINTIVQRFYAHDNPLKPTLLGETVVTAVRPNGGKIFSPDMTSELEEQMDKIAHGEMTREQVVSLSRQLLQEVMAGLIEKKDDIAPLFWSSLETLGVCPECGHAIKIKRAKKSGKRFAGCSNWPECSWSAPLPQFGEILPIRLTEDKYQSCEICGSPMVMVFSKGKRAWTTCINMSCPSKEKPAEAGEADKESA